MKLIISLLMAVIITAASAVVTTITTAVQAAYGQGELEDLFASEGDSPEVVTGGSRSLDNNSRSEIMNMTLNQIQNMNITSFQIWEDGRLHIFDNNNTRLDLSDDTSVSTTHPWTAENGTVLLG